MSESEAWLLAYLSVGVVTWTAQAVHEWRRTGNRDALWLAVCWPAWLMWPLILPGTVADWIDGPHHRPRHRTEYM